MSERQSPSSDNARRRAYHRDRAIVRKIGAERTAYAVDRMTEAELRLLLTKCLDIARDKVIDGRDVVLARCIRDAQAAAAELFLRGVQLRLPGIDD